MLSTYANDNKLSLYPFCDCQLPFSPGCITYIGICLKGDPTGYPLYASAVSISTEGVLVSICRETGGTPEDLGSVYVSTVDGTAHATLGNAVASGTACVSIDREVAKLCYGRYTGKFYLDPQCVLYIPGEVLGFLAGLELNGTQYVAGQNIAFAAMGDAIEFTEPEQEDDKYVTMLRGTTAVNAYSFIETASDEFPSVSSVNEMEFHATSEDPYPVITVVSSDPGVELYVQQGAEVHEDEAIPENIPDVIIEICGTSAFPNCYDSNADEAHED